MSKLPSCKSYGLVVLFNWAVVSLVCMAVVYLCLFALKGEGPTEAHVRCHQRCQDDLGVGLTHGCPGTTHRWPGECQGPLLNPQSSGPVLQRAPAPSWAQPQWQGRQQGRAAGSPLLTHLPTFPAPRGAAPGELWEHSSAASGRCLVSAPA